MPKEPDQAVQAEEVRTGDEAKGGDAGGSSLQKTDTTKSIDERIAEADTPEALERLTQELASTPAPKESAAQEQSEEKEKEGAEKDEGGEGEKKGEGEEKESGESKEKTEAGDDAAKEKTEEEAEKDEDDGEGDEFSKSQQIRTRIADGDEVGKLTLVILKGNSGRVKAGLKPLSLEAATAQAKHELGLDKAKEDGGEGKTGEGKEKSDLPDSPEAVDAKIKELREQKAKVWRDEVDMDKVNAIEEQIDQLRELKLTLREKAVTTEKTAEQEYDRQFEASKTQAVESYPFVSEPDSEAAKRMQEIDAEMEQSKDPTFHDPNKPLIIAQMVAKELRIAPRRKGGQEAKSEVKEKAGAAVKTAAKPPVGKSVVASGSNRTVTQTTQSSQREAAIDKITSIEELKKFGVAGD